MPQLMPLLWAISGFILFVILLVAMYMYGMGYLYFLNLSKKDNLGFSYFFLWW